jgi:hypothetical protein
MPDGWDPEPSWCLEKQTGESVAGDFMVRYVELTPVHYREKVSEADRKGGSH